MSTSEETTTLKHSYIKFPTTRGLRKWLQKALAREIKKDAVLTALCSLLLGWTLFSLVNALQGRAVIQ